MTERAELVNPLTPQEERVVALLSENLSYREVAQQLQLSINTVKNHVRNAASKIEGDTPAQVRVVCWFRGGSTWTFGRHPSESA